jgi:hypothetical protein
MLALASVPAVAVAGKGGGGGSLSFSISMGDSAQAAGSYAGDMNFYVTRSIADNKEVAWVSNQCWDANGNKVVDQDNAIQWGMWDSLEGQSGAMPSGGTHCTAYVTLRPWQDRPSGDASIDYDVG